MKKPTVYLDTSVISAYWYQRSDVSMLARRLRTRDWWKLERRYFQVMASTFVEIELRAGSFPKQSECLKTVRRIRYLPVSNAIDEWVEELLSQSIVPSTKETDAAHLAICCVHEIDYLLTWNYAHLANPVVQAKLEKMCADLRITSPL
jgi:predicted nucleic acid-binding protein